MDKNENQMTLGTWDNIDTEEADYSKKIDFEVNKKVTVRFKPDFKGPIEKTNNNGVYYIFPCEMLFIQDTHTKSEDRVIMTSAWTLLKGLKKAMPLANKTLEITKTMKDGRQMFEVK